MKEVTTTFESIVPIMFNRFPPPRKPGDTEKKKKQTIEEKLWFDDKGVYIPTDNIRMLLIGNRFRTGAAKIYGSEYQSKKGKKFVDFCKACVWIIGEGPKKDKVYFKPKRKKWDDTDVRSFINATGGRDTTERPILTTPWSLTFTVSLTDDSVGEELIHKMYEVAGLRCGLGVYGPTFGRFTVTQWDVKKAK
jgi:hypothetical protein